MHPTKSIRNQQIPTTNQPQCSKFQQAVTTNLTATPPDEQEGGLAPLKMMIELKDRSETERFTSNNEVGCNFPISNTDT